MKQILLIVDPQNDFITGSLAVEGAKEKMMKLAQHIKEKGHKYDSIWVTMDSHSKSHCSFEENGGIWKPHCILGTKGWSVPTYLDVALLLYTMYSGKSVNYYKKGTEVNKEEYSIFENKTDGFTLYKEIRELIKEGEFDISVCGIAGDYCVLETIKGLRKYIGDSYITVLFEYIASIDGGKKLKEYISF